MILPDSNTALNLIGHLHL